MNPPPALPAPAEIEPALATALARVARELAEVGATLQQLEVLLALIASAAAAK